MSVLMNLLGIRKIKTPVFYNEFSEENENLNDLIDLKEKVKSDKRDYIERDIELFESRIQGEKNVYLELKNSSIPMICLNNIRIQDGEYVAQLDFIVITAQFIMILETKQLNGDIYVNESGEFIRYIRDDDGEVIKKEEIPSPVEQNDRHMRIVRNMLINEGVISRVLITSGAVIGNKDSIINRSKAPIKVKSKIFECDKLTNIIKEKINYYKNDTNIYEDKMKEIAEFFINKSNAINYDYMNKYSLTEEDFMEQQPFEEFEDYEDREVINESAVTLVENVKVKTHEDLSNELKRYRMRKSREEKIKPYFIYNNEMLEEIIRLNPDNKKELIQIRGFGPVKIEKFGQDIINILKG